MSLAAFESANREFQQLIASVRPELHRYCARITGSVIDGEDVVQDVLAKAFYTLSLSAEMPPLRPWLFRMAHNAAIDFCRRYERTHVEAVEEVPEADVPVGAADPATVRAALTGFLALPIRQRSAVILKDVLGLSLEEIAEAMETSVLAVKAALVRGRQTLRDNQASDPWVAEPTEDVRSELDNLNRYASLFNAQDWDGLRAILANEVQLDLVSRASRRGPLKQYLTNYAELPPLRAVVGFLEGRPALAVHDPASSPTPKYFILLEWAGDRVAAIRDFRYVDYIAELARFRPR
jgi:RNA polymerase sigma-70 factor (ECF subfamily)